MTLKYNFNIFTGLYDSVCFVIERELIEENIKQNEFIYKDLINYAEQGILSIDDSLDVEYGYNNECVKIFGKEILNLPLHNIIYPDNFEKQEYLRALLFQIMKENRKSKINVLMSLLPEKVTINDKIIGIKFKQLSFYNTNKKKFVIILTDLTDKEKIVNEVERERHILKMVVNVVSSYSDLVIIIKDYMKFCDNIISKAMNQSVEKLNLEILREIHTFKGNFGQMDMINTYKNLHDLETKLYKEKNNIKHMTMNEFIK